MRSNLNVSGFTWLHFLVLPIIINVHIINIIIIIDPPPIIDHHDALSSRSGEYAENCICYTLVYSRSASLSLFLLLLSFVIFYRCDAWSAYAS